jgi:hypothetical protein
MGAQKQLTLKLKSVSYEGKTIGREFTFEITVGSVTKRIRRDVAHGTTAAMSKSDSIILTETIQSGITNIPVKIRVTENDPISDDTAETSGLVQFNYDQASIQSSSLSISVKENSLIPLLNPPVTAELTFNFEVQVSEMGIRYLPEQGGQGFVDVIVTSTGETIALPGYLKSNYIKIANNRDYFIPYEGKWKDQELSITRKPDGESYLTEGKVLGAARIVVNPTTARLWYGAVGSQVSPVVVEIDPQKPLPDGVYNLSVPDEPHRDFGAKYLDKTPYAMVWYPIPADINQDGIEDDRFLHCGNVSAGCITVRDFSYWTKLYKYLYNRRLKDGFVGVVTIDSQYKG